MMTIDKIRKILFNLLGKQVKIIYCGGRNKKEIYNGYIFKLYRSVFIIKTTFGDTKCFSYADVLTKTVKIIY